MFEDVRHERSLVLLLLLTDPNILGQSKVTDHEYDFIKKFRFRETTSTTHFERTRSHVFIGTRTRKVFSA